MIAIVKSNFNQEVTDALLTGCVDCLNETSTAFELFEVPGAVETVGFSNKLVAAKKYAGLIVIGAVIKGDTDHYEYVCDYVGAGPCYFSRNFSYSYCFWDINYAKRGISAGACASC
ncbi:MAG: 6,7-dimethyl-8-ribityllumazine synthase [Bacteroidota bacterium]